MTENAWLTVLVERIILFGWLVKDFGWMTTDVYLGFPFGALSFLLHLYLVFFDHRKNFQYYNISLLCWVTGNCLWMTTEFFDSHRSSSVFAGPHIPLQGIPAQDIDNITTAKIVLFCFGIFMQLVMYGMVWCNKIPLPRDDDEDVVMINEASRIFCSHRSPDQWNNLDLTVGSNSGDEKTGESDSVSISLFKLPSVTDCSTANIEAAEVAGVVRKPSVLDDRIDNSCGPLSLAYIENTYIIFWIAKDLFWSFGGGDPKVSSQVFTATAEALAMLFGALALAVYFITAYLYRRDLLALMDCITTVLWISANFVWMCGEFFIRYDNSLLDDMNQGNDTPTRLASTVFFLLGIFIQLCVIYTLTLGRVRILCSDTRTPSAAAATSSAESGSVSYRQLTARGAGKAQKSQRRRLHHVIEMFSIPTFVQYKRWTVTFSPQDHRIGSMDESDSDVSDSSIISRSEQSLTALGECIDTVRSPIFADEDEQTVVV